MVFLKNTLCISQVSKWLTLKTNAEVYLSEKKGATVLQNVSAGDWLLRKDLERGQGQ